MKRAFILGVLLVGCGGNSVLGTGGNGGDGGAGGGGAGGQSTSSGTADGGGGGGGGGSDPVPGEQSVTFGPVKVASGEENTQCVQVRLGNADILRAHQIHNVLSPGSHHLIVYRTTDTEEKLTPYDCKPFVDTLDPSKGSPLMVTQKHEETLILPENVAFTLTPKQMVRLEMHYINATADELEVKATATFVPIAEKDFKYEADFLFLGDPDISIPAQSSFKLGPVFLPLGKLIPDIVGEPKFFGLTGHTHQWGTNVKVNLASNANDEGTPVYDVANWQWSEPETVQHDPGFSIPADGGFKFSCEWDNKTDKTVGFGESANAEMCFFWAYYYPSKGAYVCAHTEQAPQVTTDLCCPGSPYCGFLK
jgi:hypothetical protein